MISFVLFLVNIAVGVFTLTSLLNWFVVPYFGIPAVSYALAFGFISIAAFFKKQLTMASTSIIRKEPDYKPETYSMYIITMDLLLLGVGYIVKTFFL